MVGVLAVSAALEDYPVQTGKKQRRDEDPPGKPITNYFSPVSKSSDRGLLSSKHSNIADYFIRCSPASSKERTPKKQTPSPVCGARSRGSPSTPLTGSPRPASRTAKPGRRRLVRRLGDLAPACDGSGGRKPSNSGIMGSDTAALLAEICSQTEDLGHDDNNEDDVVFQSETFTAGGTTKIHRRVLRRPRVETEQNNEEPPTTDPKEQLSSRTSTVSSGGQTSALDSSLELLGDKSALRTKTISDDHSISAPSLIDPTDLAEQLPSPKTVTIQAQVHLSPPQHSQNAAKIASIFKKNRANKKRVATPSPDSDQIGLVVPKRKSNVVILEDDLELAVIDVEAGEPMRQRSTQAERQQFMKAFRQAGDAAKANTKKTPARKKDPSEGMEDPPKLEAEEQLPDKAVNEESKAEQPNKVQKLKRRRNNLSAPSAETPKSKELPRDHAEEPDKVQRLQRKKVRTPRSSNERPPDKAEEPEKVHRLQRKKVRTPRSSNERPPDKAEEPNKTQKVKKQASTPRSETPKSPPEEEEPMSPIRPSPVLRRSLRRQMSNPTSRSPVRTGSPLLMSTPKVQTPCQTADIYKAEVITVPSDTESPIRMRFTRLRRNNSRRSDSDADVSTPGCRKIPQSSKKTSKVKQILEKAKAIQQGLVKAETPQRRSTRQKSRVPASQDFPKSQENEEKTTNLRSLNDVLGKKVMTKIITAGSKREAKKKMEKGSAVTEDGSEDSDNSQDGEQVRARRAFLMSGLPESLRRQMARTSAAMEAYAVSGSSFQTVTHVQQRDGGTMWSLSSPSCRLLTDLSPPSSWTPDISRLALSLGDFTAVNSESAMERCAVPVHTRPLLSDVVRCRLLAEIRSQNPRFPARRFLTQFLKKQSDSQSESSQPTEKCVKAVSETTQQDAGNKTTQQQAGNKTTQQQAGNKTTQQQAGNKTTQQQAGNEATKQEAGNGAKRKRKDSPFTKSKRRKPAVSVVGEASQCDSAAGSPPSSACQGPPSALSRVSEEPDVVILEEQSRPPCLAEDPSSEDVLWTEKYQPHSSTEIIGNSAAVQSLHSWLREWKVRAEKEEKRSRVQKTGMDKDESWSTGDFHDSEDSDEDSLCNTLLITGPPGVGKTAAVYACAQELGFKVFEVNASCQRSGRQILAQLKEATQSHQVDQQGVHAHKPCFFSSSSTVRSPRKLNSPKTVVSSPRKSPRGPGHKGGLAHKSGLAPKSLNFFFKAAPKQNPEVKKTISELVRAPQSDDDGKASRAERGSGAEESQRRTATSLILFEEVDVIFDDDTGFLSAIKTFMSTTKRPVILTTSDPMFRMMFDGAFEDLSFHAPSVVNVTSFLQVLCLAENLRTESKDLMTFLTAVGCDVRASILHLQFWARSGGVTDRLPAGSQIMETSDAFSTRTAPESSTADEPACHAGCAENLLGVDNIIAPTDCLIPFVKERILDPVHWDTIVRLLAEFHARNIYFTPSNLEFLLPLPVRVEEPAAPSENPALCPLSNADHLTEEANIQLSATMRRRRKLLLLNDSDLFESDSLDEALAASTAEPEPRPVEPCAHSEVRPVRRALSSRELPASLLVCQCLDSMAEFADHMSFLDCSTCGTADPAHTCRPTWTGSRLKHGLCDGLRSDSRDWWNGQSGGDIRALVEALSFQKCSSKLHKSLVASLELCKRSGEDPSEELTLRVTQARHQVYFGQPAASTGAAESRLSVVRDVMSHRSFIGLGNRAVNVTEYLPALRHICRLQKSKEEGKSKRRFLHYLEGIHLELPKATLRILAEDFP